MTPPSWAPAVRTAMRREADSLVGELLHYLWGPREGREEQHWGVLATVLLTACPDPSDDDAVRRAFRDHARRAPAVVTPGPAPGPTATGDPLGMTPLPA